MARDNLCNVLIKDTVKTIILFLLLLQYYEQLFPVIIHLWYHHTQLYTVAPLSVCLAAHITASYTSLFCPPFTQQWAMFYELISSQLRSQPLPRGMLHPLSENSNSQDSSPSRLNVVPGCVITEYVMGMQGHLGLQSQVLALQLTASSIIDRGKPIRTICSPQRSARAA